MRHDVGTVDADEGTCSGCLSFSVFITRTDGSETITSFASPVVSDDVATVVIIPVSDCFAFRVSFAVEDLGFEFARLSEICITLCILGATVNGGGVVEGRFGAPCALPI